MWEYRVERMHSGKGLDHELQVFLSKLAEDEWELVIDQLEQDTRHLVFRRLRRHAPQVSFAYGYAQAGHGES